MRLALALALASGCACVPPEGENERDHFRDRWEAVKATYTELGHGHADADWECLYITLRSEDLFMCGDVRTDVCFHDGWPGCPHIEISKAAINTSGLEHDLLHFLDPDMPHSADFSRIEYKAYEKTH